MQITDVRIRQVAKEGKMKAVVSITLDNEFVVHDIKVIYAREKYFIVMPSKKNSDGSYRDIAHPINAQFRAEFESAVLNAYHEQLAAFEATNKEDSDAALV